MASRKWIAVVLFAVALPVRAGEERHGPLGVALEVPARYEAIPLQPTEPWIQLRYAGEARAKETGPRRELLLLRIDWRPDPDPCPTPAPITTFERYVDQELETWRLGEATDAKARPGWACSELELVPRTGKGGSIGYRAFVLRSPERSWVLLGRCDTDELEKEARLWRRCAESLEFFAPVAPKDEAKWKRHYERNPLFRNSELRLRLRARMVTGWEAEDTENYLILTSSKKESLVDLLARRLEAMRGAYVERFPPAADVTAVSTVRICEDKADYHRYGGPEGTAGYWSPSSEELVLFVFEMGANWKEGKENVLLVMYHEAFHQYIHYAAGELAPHSWFNEGYGDYFGGANFTQQGNLGRIEVHPWRIRLIQEAISRHMHPSWRTIAWMTQEEFYGPDRPIHYAMAWSMIYFLNESKKARKDPLWSRILPAYYETLKTAHAREQARLATEGLTEDEEKVAEAEKAARDEASTAAFHDVDLDAIEAAWREFTLELKPPK